MRYQKQISRLTLSIISLSFLFSCQAFAAEQFPAFPMAFYGSATLNGSGMPAGTKIGAFADGQLAGEVVMAEGGIYGYDNPTKAKIVVGSYTGSLEFKYCLTGESQYQSGNPQILYPQSFEPGKTVQLDLAFEKTTSPASGGSGGSSGGSGGSGGGGGGGGAGGGTPQTVATVDTKTATTTITATTTKLSEDKPAETKEERPVTQEKVAVLGIETDYRTLQFNQIVEDARVINLGDIASLLKNNGQKRDIKQEAQDFKKYFSYDTKSIKAPEMTKMNYFILYGTKSTIPLGAGERAGVLNSYRVAFGKYPQTESEWKDAILIANGRWPAQKNTTAENNAKKVFVKIYLRNPVLLNANDNAAVSVIAYGLRPDKRNLKNEAFSMKAYKNIFKRNPSKADDWDAVRAIAYSGAKR